MKKVRRKARRLLAFVMVVSIIAVASCSAAPKSPVNGGPLDNEVTTLIDEEYTGRCWSVGDSIFAGTGLYDYGASTYMTNARPVARYGTPILSFEGPYGKSIRNQLLSAVKQYGWPDCVVIHAGGFDMINRAGVPPLVAAQQAYQNELMQIDIWLTIHSVDAYWVQVVPTLVGSVLWSQQGFRTELNTWAVESFDSRSINCSAEMTGNQFDFFTDPELLLLDQSHPTNETAVKLAECIDQKVNQVSQSLPDNPDGYRVIKEKE